MQHYESTILVKNYGSRGIVGLTVIPDKLDIVQKLLQITVLIFFQFVSYSS